MHNNEEKFLECIDRALASLGESSRQVIYWHLNILYGIKRTDVPKNPQKFRECLESIFGSGASALEILIEMEIRSAFQIHNKAESLEQVMKEAMGSTNETE
ncbi:MAG: hypothetical protein ABSE82_01935 [Nitrososphaerales archaeon]